MSNALVIVKNNALRHEVRATLTSMGLHVTATNDGQDGLRRLHNGAFDIVVADMLVRTGNGMEVARQIATVFPFQPIIAISGSSLAASDMYQTLVGELGVNGLLVAPLHTNALAKMVRDVLRQQPEVPVFLHGWASAAERQELFYHQPTTLPLTRRPALCS